MPCECMRQNTSCSMPKRLSAIVICALIDHVQEIVHDGLAALRAVFGHDLRHHVVQGLHGGEQAEELTRGVHVTPALDAQTQGLGGLVALGDALGGDQIHGFPAIPVRLQGRFRLLQRFEVPFGGLAEEGDLLRAHPALIRAGGVGHGRAVLVQLGLLAHAHHAVQPVGPGAMGGFAPRLALDLLALDGLAAVDAGAGAQMHRALLRVLPVGSLAVFQAGGDEAHRLAPGKALDLGQHHPAVLLLGQRKSIQQRGAFATVRAGDFAAIEEPLLVNFWNIEELE